MKPLTERQIQIQCVSWFKARYPEASRVFMAIPNGSARNPWTAKNLRDEGVLSGAPDLLPGGRGWGQTGAEKLKQVFDPK